MPEWMTLKTVLAVSVKTTPKSTNSTITIAEVVKTVGLTVAKSTRLFPHQVPRSGFSNGRVIESQGLRERNPNQNRGCA